MKLWTIPQLKKHLKTMDEKQLQEMIVDLYKQSKEAKQLINSTCREADYEKRIAEEYKEKIYRAFFPKSMRAEFSLPKAKKLLKEAEKLCKQPENIADIQLTFAECGVEIANMYGDMYDSFYQAVAGAYGNAVDATNEDKTGEAYKRLIKRCTAVFNDSEWMAWGLGEAMTDIYFELDQEE